MNNDANMAMSRLAAIVESSDDAIIINDLNGLITDWNRGAEKIFGYTASEMIGTAIVRLIPAERQAEEQQILDAILRGEAVKHFETVRQTKDGRLIDVSVTASPMKDAAGLVIGASKVARDITVAKAREREILRLSRLYAALSQVNQAIVWTPERDAMLARICRALVDDGGFRLAWIGQHDPQTRAITPLACVGEPQDFVRKVRHTSEDSQHHHCLCGPVVREGRSFVSNDLQAGQEMEAWETEVQQAGVRSAGVFPVRFQGGVWGVLGVYAGEPDAFQDQEVALLEEAATDLSFALDNLAREAARQQAEAALRESQAMLQSIFQSAPVGIGIVTNRILGWTNERLHAMTGYSRAELEGQSSRILYPSDEDFDYVGRAKYDQIRQRGTGMIETRWKRKDGQIIDVLLGSTPINPDDLAQGVTFAALDITDRKLAKAALHESEEQFRTMADALPQLAWIAKADGFIFWYNQRWYEYTGTTPAQMEGWGWQSVHDPAVLPQVMERWQGSIASGKPFDMEFPLRGADGQIHTFLTRVQPLKDASGQVVRWYGTNTDVEPLKQAEAAQARLAMAVEQAAETIVITDTQGTILYANPAFEKTTGYTCTEAIGQNPRVLKSGKQDAEFYRQLWETLERGEVWHGHFANKRKDSTVYEEEATISPVRDAAGKIINYVAVKRDVTREVQLEAQFRQSQKMESFGQLAGGVAHDFNNLLAVIQMQIDLLRDDGQLTPEQLDSIGEIGNAAQRATDLTRQLLIFGRKEKMQPRDLDLNECINNIFKMLRRILGENFELELKLTMQPVCLHADAGMLDQVVMNLVVNARDAMPEGGRLIIETAVVEFDETIRAQSVQARPGSFVCLRVSDHGCGIPPENLARIFEPFFTTKDVGKGTGLGLATVFGIVQQHQGWINVYSEVGRGTTFRLYLPRLDQLPAASQKTTVSPLNTLRCGTETILLVEDDESVRSATVKILSRLGYRLLPVNNAIQALEVWRERRDEIDLVLTDLVMPGGMNGKELGERLLQENPQVKVIYASGYSAEVVDKAFFLEAGVNFISKPFEAQKLAKIIRDCLDAPAVGT